MLPGNINPKQMKAMMKKMGMQIDPIENVEKIVITTPEGIYTFDEAEVVGMTMQGVTTYQVTGTPRFEVASPAVPEEDVALVREQTGASDQAVRDTLAATRGDIAEAILRLASHD